MVKGLNYTYICIHSLSNSTVINHSSAGMIECEQSRLGKQRWCPCMCPTARTPTCYWCYCHLTCSNMDQWWVADMTLSLKKTTWILVGKLITLGPFPLWRTSDSFGRNRLRFQVWLCPYCPPSFSLSHYLRAYRMLAVVVQLLRCLWLFATPWTVARQALLSFTSPRVCSNSCPLSWWCYLQESM